MKRFLALILLIASLCLFPSCTIEGNGVLPDISIKEDGSIAVGETDTFFSSTYNGNTIVFSRSHTGSQLYHGTHFSITVFNDQNQMTHYYRTPLRTPCQNGVLECDGRMATLENATAIDEVVATLYPAVQNEMLNRITQAMIQGQFSSDELKEVLFKSDVIQWFEQEKDAIGSEVKMSAISTIAGVNDLLSQLFEVGIGVYEIAEEKIQEAEDQKNQATSDGFWEEGEDPNDYANMTVEEKIEKEFLVQLRFDGEKLPFAQAIKQNVQRILMFFRGENDKAIGGIAHLLPENNTSPWQYEQLLQNAKKHLHELTFQTLSDYAL